MPDDQIYLELLAEATRARWSDQPADLTSLYEDKPFLCQETVRVVPLSEIQIAPVWSPGRLGAIKSWGSRALIISRLTSVPLLESDKGNYPGRYDMISSDRLVRLSRGSSGEKYKISDGIHRLNALKEMGFPFVLAHVTDCEPWGEREFEAWRHQRPLAEVAG